MRTFHGGRMVNETLYRRVELIENRKNTVVQCANNNAENKNDKIVSRFRYNKMNIISLHTDDIFLDATLLYVVRIYYSNTRLKVTQRLLED
jgi:hypothetical protein